MHVLVHLRVLDPANRGNLLPRLADSAVMLDHERLDVYQAAIQFLALSDDLVGALPRGRSYLADQLRRAALSVPLNIAEGTGKTSAPDRARYYAVSRGSAMECGALLDAMRALQLTQTERHDHAKALLVRVVSMLTRMCR